MLFCYINKRDIFACWESANLFPKFQGFINKQQKNCEKNYFLFLSGGFYQPHTGATLVKPIT